MAETNFMLQDIYSTLLGFLLFPLVLITPGYVTGWLFDLFEFRARLIHSRLAISLFLSVAVSPVLFYLTSSLFSFQGTMIALVLVLAIFVFLFFRDKPSFPSFQNKALTWTFASAAVWVVFALFSLVDIQWGRELYYSVVGYDYTTRISIVDAMTRTGVPPVNPSYYPGHPVQMNFLYFFWYILGSIIDRIGGRQVDARGAFFASVIWSGLALMAVIAFYLRQRRDGHIWKRALIGIALLTVSGLDFLPAIFSVNYANGAVGDIEHWNEQITAWMGALLWVPHHIAALVACLAGTLLVLSMGGKTTARKYLLMVIAGFAFASAFGLSVLVTLVFVLFWGLWILIKLARGRDMDQILPMVFAGLVALVLSAKFLLGVLSGLGGGGAGNAFPIVFDVRAFSFVDVLTATSPKSVQTFFRLIFLPVNYFFELGFYFLVAFIWLGWQRGKLRDNPYAQMEAILLGTSFFVGTFMRSTLIESNDLGWRAWLPGQFILLIWGVDVLEHLFVPASDVNVFSPRTKYNLILLAMLGIVTTIMDVSLLRFAYYISFGHEVGRQNYSARQAYTVINRTLPQDVVVQYNPASVIDRPSGLYGMHQSAISDRSAYGVPHDVYLASVANIGRIFDVQSGWDSIDALCRKYFIEVLVLSNNDPLWKQIGILDNLRSPLYLDNYFAVFTCGGYTPPHSAP